MSSLKIWFFLAKPEVFYRVKSTDY
jgi:hypothetical protein